MKRILTLSFCILSLIGFSQGKFSFDRKVHKFPKTKEGVILEHDYHFTNTGNQPILIEEIKVECSCTQVTFPKEPILPRKKGVIHLTFDTNNKYLFQDRILEVHSNAKKSPVNIRLKVMVINEKK